MTVGYTTTEARKILDALNSDLDVVKRRLTKMSERVSDHCIDPGPALGEAEAMHRHLRATIARRTIPHTTKGEC